MVVLCHPGDLATFPQELRERENLPYALPNLYAKSYLTVLRTIHSLRFKTKMKLKL